MCAFGLDKWKTVVGLRFSFENIDEIVCLITNHVNLLRVVRKRDC